MFNEDSGDSRDPGLTGSQVLDLNGQAIGTIKDVVYDGSNSWPTWLVVKPGIFQAEHFVPVRGSYRTEADRVVVPFDKRQVRAAPKAGDHVVTSETRALLAQHYHLVD